MVDPNTGNLIVYNGEIYNYRELREDLRAQGAIFRTESDTEVILAAFARWGIECLSRLAGMYALAIFEPAAERLHLARDPLGIKPLYYCIGDDRLVFASEVRAMAASGLVEQRFDRRALASLFAYGAVPAPLTLFREVQQLEPGTRLEIGPGLSTAPLRPRHHWSFPAIAEPVRDSRAPASEIEALLRGAVALHMQSDVPLGIFLSSGIDSTALAALAGELRQGDVDTFTVRVAGAPGIDESESAARTARQMGLRHHMVEIGESDAIGTARRWFDACDQPTIDGLNTYIIARAVRESGVTVALSGLGGDELFGGYPTFREVPVAYRVAHVARALPPRLRKSLVDRVTRSRSDVERLKAQDLVFRTRDLASTYLCRRRLYSDQQMAAFGLSEDMLEDWLPEESHPRRWVDARDPWATVRTLELRFYMGNMLLRDADVFGMAHGLEIRVPMLDQRVLERALTLTMSTASALREPPKAFLRHALGQRLPTHVAALPKRGFALDQARWISGAMRDEITERIGWLSRAGLVDGDAVNQTWRRFLRDPKPNAWSRPWLLAAVGSWVRRFGTSLTAEVTGEARTHPVTRVG
jgi:asparagine synthase (glutamine-hydrolysing)